MVPSLPIADCVYPASALPDRARRYGRDTVTLGWEQRTHVHGRRTTDGGIAFGTSLPRGTVLQGGDCLILDSHQLVVSIVERPEAVFVIDPPSPLEWGLFAYHIGNRHQPMMIANGSLICPDVPGVEALLQQCRIPYRRATRPFTPVAAVAGHHH